ncbi:hypothetical protein BS47DRAFT_1399194 [Hydnum rufescens UP504]|uniref:Uncharacterized protein n=1 Tax=Hydnum rufescens UP504 TaxID=1448309 RepID=A0A9P6AJA5_9AGAM|nr:hypothetical protein BS47DRAFT_1399194 [Hydnum rufescens UP504]
MPIQQLSLVYRHFDHIDDDPFIGIHSSTPICYSPTPENSFEGIVLSKSIKWTRYVIWSPYEFQLVTRYLLEYSQLQFSIWK